MKGFKLPENLKAGDVVGPYDKPWYEVIEITRMHGGRFVYAKVRHIPDGGLSVREWDTQSDTYGTVPFQYLRKVSG